MTLVPAETPVTTPELVIVATPGEADTHGFVTFGIPEPVNEVVNPTQTFGIPDIVGNGAIFITILSSA